MHMIKIERALLVVAMLAALANFEGLSMATDAETVWQRGFCAAIAVGVFTAIWVFWHVAFHVVPSMQDPRLQIGAWLTTCLGALCILGLSAWWSVAALGGPVALQAIHEAVVAQAEDTVASSRASGGRFEALLPGLEGLNADLDAMTACERRGCLTSGVGAGGVSSLLSQLRDRANAILSAARESKTRLDGMSGKASACLGGMRHALSMPGSNAVREEELSRQVDCFNGALADLDNVEGGSGIAQALDAFTSGVVVPVAVSSDKQKAVAEKLLTGLKQRTAELAQAARATVPASPFRAVVMARVNAMVAVVRMAGTVVPAWVTGICLDLAPLALLLLLTLKATAERAMPDESFLDRPIRDIVALRRAWAVIEPRSYRLPQLPPSGAGPDETLH
jgi:hypothetical protein